MALRAYSTFQFSGRAYRDLDGWRETGGARPAPRSGRHEVEGSQGATFLSSARNDGEAGRGRKSRPAVAGIRARRSGSDDGLRSDMPNRGRHGRVSKTDRVTRRRPSAPTPGNASRRTQELDPLHARVAINPYSDRHALLRRPGCERPTDRDRRIQRRLCEEATVVPGNKPADSEGR
jgi:hypothetical protein